MDASASLHSSNDMIIDDHDSAFATSSLNTEVPPSPSKYRELNRIQISAGPLELAPLSPREKVQRNEEQKEEKEAMMRLVSGDESEITSETPSSISWWTRAKNYVKYSFISRETESAFGDVLELMKQLLKDLEWRPVDILMALLVLNTYHNALTFRTGIIIDRSELEFVKRANHFMKFAAAAYGWKLLYGYQFKYKTKGVLEGLRTKDAANLKVIFEHTGLKEEDLLVAKWTSETIFHPGYFLAVDHSTNSIVLSIRGTFHMRDALTDMVASYVPFKGGFAHSGMLMAAKQKVKDLHEMILQTMTKYPTYELVIVGHSLGAGTASLIAMLLYDEYNIPIRCYAYAPPPVVSLDLANRCKSFITSFALNDDIVPRLCYGSMEDLKKLIQNLLLQNENGKLQRLFQVMSAGNNLGANLTAKLSNYLGCNPTPDLQAEKIAMSDRIYPPGRVYLIYNNSEKVSIVTKYDTMEVSSPSLFKDIIISSSMFTDHMPDLYEISLQNVLDKLVEGETNKIETADPKQPEQELKTAEGEEVSTLEIPTPQ